MQKRFYKVLNISGPVAHSVLFRQIRFNLFPQWADAVVIMAQTNPRVSKHRLQHKWPGKINSDQEAYLSTQSGNRKIDLVGTHKVISEGRTRVWSRVMTGTCCRGTTSAWKSSLCVAPIGVKIICHNNTPGGCIWGSNLRRVMGKWSLRCEWDRGGTIGWWPSGNRVKPAKGRFPTVVCTLHLSSVEALKLCLWVGGR